MSWLIAWHEHLVLDESEAPKKFVTWNDARLWTESLWGEHVFANTSRVFIISEDQLAALRDWRSRHGQRWRMWLKKEWDRSDCRPELRQLRNTFGPEWLHKQKLVR